MSFLFYGCPSHLSEQMQNAERDRDFGERWHHDMWETQRFNPTPPSLVSYFSHIEDSRQIGHAQLPKERTSERQDATQPTRFFNQCRDSYMERFLGVIVSASTISNTLRFPHSYKNST